MSGSPNSLAKAGLLNVDAHEYGELASGRNHDLRGTWCGADSCVLGAVSGLQIVHVGIIYKNSCPACGGTILFHDRVSPLRAEKLKTKAADFLRAEAKRKARK